MHQQQSSQPYSFLTIIRKQAQNPARTKPCQSVLQSDSLTTVQIRKGQGWIQQRDQPYLTHLTYYLKSKISQRRVEKSVTAYLSFQVDEGKMILSKENKYPTIHVCSFQAFAFSLNIMQQDIRYAMSNLFQTSWPYHFTSSCYVTDVLSKRNFLRPGIYGELSTFLTIIIIVPEQQPYEKYSLSLTRPGRLSFFALCILENFFQVDKQNLTLLLGPLLKEKFETCAFPRSSADIQYEL